MVCILQVNVEQILLNLVSVGCITFFYYYSSEKNISSTLWQVESNYYKCASDPPPFTLERKDTENSTLECKENGQISNISDHKNVNKRKNRLTPLKLCSKKHDKKLMDSWDRTGGAIQSVVQEKPRPVYYPVLPTPTHTHTLYRKQRKAKTAL